MDTKKVVIGFLILALGVIVLIKNLGFFYWPLYSVFISWQMLLIAIGLILLFDKSKKNKTGGAILIALGITFLIPRLFSVSLGHIFIPSLLIAGGIFFIIRSSRRRDQSGETDRYDNFNETPYLESSIESQEYLKREFAFSSSKERWSYGEIKSMEIEAIFSGVEIDMLDVRLSQDVDRVRIKVSSIFSGVTIYVPEDWNLIIQQSSVFGSFVDKRAPHALPLEGKLVIMELDAVFGGGEIR